MYCFNVPKTLRQALPDKTIFQGCWHKHFYGTGVRATAPSLRASRADAVVSRYSDGGDAWLSQGFPFVGFLFDDTLPCTHDTAADLRRIWRHDFSISFALCVHLVREHATYSIYLSILVQRYSTYLSTRMICSPSQYLNIQSQDSQPDNLILHLNPG